MRMRLLTALSVIVGSAFSAQASASGDDSCYPSWSMLKDNLDACSNLAFLSPGNDSQVNLRLLLADLGQLPLQPQPLAAIDLEQGYGPVPFNLSRLTPPATPQPAQSSAERDALNRQLNALGLPPVDAAAAGDAFLEGEGSRCRSNNTDSAATFIEQLTASRELSSHERQALAKSRVQLLGQCNLEPSELMPAGLNSAAAQAFARYLLAASDFYSGRFNEAAQGFAGLADASQPWLKQTALYMGARTALNHAQQNAFNEYSERTPERLDRALLQQAEAGFNDYVRQYPQGTYAASARGLLRRVHWLADDRERLAQDYARQLTQPDPALRNLSLDALVSEVDNKLLMSRLTALREPLLLAISNLMAMREQAQPRLSLSDLQTQQPLFDQQPELYRYLLAAHALYVQDDAGLALQHLPEQPVDARPLDYLHFSLQLLRGLALQASQDDKAAQALWLSLLPMAQAPLQREQLELALAMSFERDEQLARVFAADSPIRSAHVRQILLSHVADAELLRQQISAGQDATERHLALFVLLYKDLTRGRFADFMQDMQQLPTPVPEEKLGYGLGYVYDAGPSLTLFQWQGDAATSGYRCPAIAQTAERLVSTPRDPQALNCLGEFILRNRLDGMPLDQRRHADSLGGSSPGFSGEVFSRLDGYRIVIADPKATRDDKAYALFRAINCYAPSGYNSCGGQEAEPAVRKAWFRQLKGEFASTQWGKTLQYYW